MLDLPGESGWLLTSGRKGHTVCRRWGVREEDLRGTEFGGFVQCVTGLGESLCPLTTDMVPSHMPRATQMSRTDTQDDTDAQNLYLRRARFPV